ncbi:transcriptional regulator [Nocardia caishijiensis]|uniref:DNA-binding transcriptional regulator of glucitol operon n=1 Tax=Nocardia caishijiensis TaxID=184756 RepID=A0ABQ6YEI6_9NOCA|nr:transcriptional regulator [Nocardia caishijiensis]KAF0835830.1 DNA-binding transcriptional regulator of glucitol operon [Nocardia caishijiensis]
MSVPPSRPAYNRPALIALVVVVALGCLALAWWQWERFDSATGTGQNLGYALQWPLFAAFAVFAFFRFVRLEREAGEPAAPRPDKAEAPREIPAGLLPERPKAAAADDPDTAAYNQYLAGLHANDIDAETRAAGLHATERNAG